MDVLCQKHPTTLSPAPSALLPRDSLSEFEDVEVTASHMLLVTHWIQGGAGPGGCDAGYWREYNFTLWWICMMQLLLWLDDY